MKALGLNKEMFSGRPEAVSIITDTLHGPIDWPC